MAANGGWEKAKGYVRRVFGGGKVAATGIRQVWRGRGTRGGTLILISE